MFKAIESAAPFVADIEAAAKRYASAKPRGAQAAPRQPHAREYGIQPGLARRAA